jgi:HD-GYP domain-containing protein (c-di-GMP phosphodiesterase class II)
LVHSLHPTDPITPNDKGVESSTAPSPNKDRLTRIIARPRREESGTARLRALELENERLRLLLETAQDLSAERNLDLLMGLIVERTSKVMNCERSSVFLLDRRTQELYSLFAQGLDAKEIRFSVFSGLAGWAVRLGETVNIEDAYRDERFNQAVDRQTGYRTQAVLCLPLYDRRGQIMGAIQCLNKRGASDATQVFDKTDEALLGAFAAQAAIFLENSALQREMDRLLEAVVAGISRALDDRDPCTSGHSRRVTLMALALGKAVHEAATPPFKDVLYTRERLRRLRYAGLLHDVGKIGVREHILCKKNKLLPTELDALRARFDAARDRLRADTLEQAWPKRATASVDEILAADFAPAAAALDSAVALLEKVNVPGPMTEAETAFLCELSQTNRLTAQEFEQLSVRSGNLTASEWADMRAHASKSRLLLSEIPWPPDLLGLPEIASGHHEKLDGAGYPEGLKGENVPFDSQVLCVADIYDGLTASDRPYKKAIPHERARFILDDEAAKGKIIPELVKLFFDVECWKAAGETTQASKA